MKLLQTNKLYPPHLGGIENVIRDIAENLAADNNFQSDVLVCQEKGKRTVENINKVKVCRTASFGRLFSLPISFDYFRLFKKVVNDYDLLLIHHPYPLASLARFLFLNKKKPVAVWYHSDIVRQKLFYLLVYPFLYLDLKAAKIIFVSSRRLAEKSKLLSKFLDKCRVIPFGVDLNLYKVDYSLKVSDLKNKYGRFMLAVGRLVYYKGYEDLLEALKFVSGKLLIIGTGPLEAELRRIIKVNSLESRVIIISDRPDNLVPYYQACEFLVFPSRARSEAFGLVQIEAMACGRPVINTDLPTGVPEVSLDGITGLTVPVGDCAKLSQAIKSLWEDDELRLKLGKGALERAQDKYSKEKFEVDLKKVLLEI
ncbi:MAG: glycosyltransferase [Patescibacteria group bacterium]|jgi:rhamnosyl/mannosyltransferase